MDNTLLRIVPTSLITLNPKPSKIALEEQTGFSTAQLRRLVVINLSNVALPDLSNLGHMALESAVKHGPLPLPSPTVNAETWRSQIVDLMRDILVPKVWPRVDTEMLITLVTGMMAFIPDPERAIQQTVYDFAMTTETLGWTSLGWIDVVSRFSLHVPWSRRQSERQSSLAEKDADHLVLWRYSMEGYRESSLPPFAIGDRNRARLLAIAVQENIPIERADHALDVILDSWEQRQRDGHTLDEAYSALQLARDLRQRKIDMRDVTLAMKLRQTIQQGAYRSQDFQAALDLLPVLQEHGLTAEDDRTETVVRLAARFLNSNRSLVELEAWLNPQPDTPFYENDSPDRPVDQ